MVTALAGELPRLPGLANLASLAHVLVVVGEAVPAAPRDLQPSRALTAGLKNKQSEGPSWRDNLEHWNSPAPTPTLTELIIFSSTLISVCLFNPILCFSIFFFFFLKIYKLDDHKGSPQTISFQGEGLFK